MRTKNKNLFSDSGFTLIELLVASTIIALLSTIGFTSFQALTRNGRDALRKTDLEQVRSALEIYKSENGSYPTPTVTCVPALPSSYISYPSDPKSPTYRYCYDWTSALQYKLCAHLENGDPSQDYECDGNGGTTDDCTDNCNYKVTNP
ncbi:prepilin-type N-terminal cleavage/methylation domain-containing protein [Candidatus Gottesmanbacteria bacterium]|nr:prepilin-type N-terminal cleavage/methylation domain-containing protein [Candidatus Gottesmanbacteria bacterium]